jgi:hypothetical protein
MSDDRMTRTGGTLPIAPHLKPKPAYFLQNFGCCPRYIRLHLPTPFAVHWVTEWVDLADATGLTIEGEA